MRGLVGVSVLYELEKELGCNGLKSCISSIAGSSIGAITMGLIMEGYSMDKILNDLMTSNSIKSIFSNYRWFGMVANPINWGILFPKYDGKNKTALIKQYVQDKTLDDWEIPAFVPIYDVGDGKCRIVNKDAYTAKTWSVIDCASSPPIYFPVTTMSMYDKNEKVDVSGYYFDGGMGVNDPSAILLANMLYKDKTKIDSQHIIHIGYAPALKDPSSFWIHAWGLTQWMTTGQILSRGLYTPDQAAQYVCDALMDSHYVNIAYPLDANLDDTSVATRARLIQTGKEWYAKHRTSILACFGKGADAAVGTVPHGVRHCIH